MRLATPIIAALAAAGCAGPAAYQEMTDEKQQVYLEGVARGIESGFRVSAGKIATIKTISADAARDMISLEIKFTPPQVERAPYDAVMKMRNQVFEQMCNKSPSKGLIDNGVSLRVELKKPSGMTMTNVALSSGACAPYRKGK
jgi:hypothetical protein